MSCPSLPDLLNTLVDLMRIFVCTGTSENSSVNGSSTIDQQEAETALRLVQYQNKALRDRLRSTAAENERLHEMLKEYRTGKVDDGPIVAHQREESQESQQTEREMQSLRDTIVSLEDSMKKKDSIHSEEMKRMSIEFEERVRQLEDTTCPKELVDGMEVEIQRVMAERDTLRSRLQDHMEVKKMSESDVAKEILVKEEELAQARALCASLEKDLGEVREASVSETASLQEQLRVQSIALEDLTKRLSDEKAAGGEKNTEELAQARALCVSLEKELGEVREASVSETASLKEQLRVQSTALEDLTKRLSDEKAAEEEKNTEELAQARALCASLEKELGEVMEASVSETASLQEQLRVQSTALEDLTKRLSYEKAAEVGPCNKCALMDDVILEKKRLAEEVAQAIKRAMTVEAERDMLRAEAESLDREYKKKISSLEEASAASASTIKDLQRAEDIQQEKVKELENALAREREQFETYSKTTEEKFRNLESIISTGSKAMEEVQRLKTLLSQAEEKLAGMETMPATSQTEDDVPSYNAVMGSTVIELQHKIQELEAALEESERTHELRDRASQVLKQEVEDLKRASKRSDIDVDYLKAVLVKGFSCGELDSKSPIFDVISRLLHFSPKDVEEAKKPKQDEATIFEILPSFEAIKNLLPAQN